jgi:hypothetical protein
MDVLVAFSYSAFIQEHIQEQYHHISIQIHTLPSPSFSLSLRTLKVPRAQEDQYNVGYNVGDKDTHISPAMTKLHVQSFVKFLALRVLAVLAVHRVVHVVDVSWCTFEELSHVGSARLTCRWLENTVLGDITTDIDVVKLGCDQSFHKIVVPNQGRG